MRFVTFRYGKEIGLAITEASVEKLYGLVASEPEFPGHLDQLIKSGSNALEAAAVTLRKGHLFAENEVDILPPILSPGKIICIGLNYIDHAKEAGFKELPTYPTVFTRFASSLVGCNAPMILPKVSSAFDYEGELVAVIGKRGRYIAMAEALKYVIGYSVFNDGSLRDYQRKSSQWTVGKNFDGTGAFGPAFVTSDELPPGAKGLKLETRLNGQVVQSATTGDMIFDIATLVTVCSEAFTLEPGDIIVTGTPAGVGTARDPKLYMKDGDTVEVSIEKIGILTNPILAETEGSSLSA